VNSFQAFMGKSAVKLKRRWMSLSLRGFFMLLTIGCVLLRWLVIPAIQQREAVEVVREAGGGLAYDFQNFSGNLLLNTPKGAPPGPSWLRDLLGIDFFANVIQVDCRDTEFTQAFVLAKLPRLRKLNLNGTSVNDLFPLVKLTDLDTLECRETPVATVTPLRGLIEMEFLQLNGTNVSDVGPLSELLNLKHLYLRNTPIQDIAPLAHLTNLEFLGLGETQVRDISPLMKLRKLKWLDLRNTPATKQDCELLQAALPQCNVEF
jgi:Leucine-rich repeat (LRR) protein